MRFLFHIAGMKTLNLPLFLLKRLTKILARIQTHAVASEYIIYHQALIKVLVVEELRKRNQSWEHFLFYRAGQPTLTQDILAQLSPASKQHPQPAKQKGKIQKPTTS